MKKRIISGILAVSMILSLSACGKKDAQEAASDAVQQSTNVTVYNVVPDDLSETVSYTGVIKASENVNVAPKVGGTVKDILVEEGQFVNAGDVLFRIDDTDLKLQYQQTLASYNSAKAGYDKTVTAGAQQSETQVTQAYDAAVIELDAARTAYNRELHLYQTGANVTAAELSYNDAVEAYNREQQLYDDQSNIILAQTTYDNALANYNRTKELYDNDTGLVAARNALKNAEDSLARVKELYDMGAAAQVDVENSTTALENARANLESMEASQKAQLDSAQAALTQAEENMRTVNTTSRAAVDAAFSAMQKAEQNLDVVRTNSKAALDAAESRLKNAENALKSAEENKNLTINVVNPQNNKTAAASLESAKAALDIARNNVNNAVVKAPISGFVASKSISEGQLTSMNAPAITLENAKSVNAEINVTESVISRLELGTPALISVRSAGVENLNGTVSILNTTKNAQGMYTVDINIPNDDDILKIGMFADITLTTASLEGIVTVPSDSVMQKEDELYVYVQNGDVAEKRVIKTGLSDDSFTQILSGINIGDIVIVKGKEYLSEKNNRITVVEG